MPHTGIVINSRHYEKRLRIKIVECFKWCLVVSIYWHRGAERLDLNIYSINTNHIPV
jgi:hypothetical protein